MTTIDFMSRLIDELDRILHSEADCRRLGLTRDIIIGWRRYLAEKSPNAMAQLVEQVCKDNEIQLALYEQSDHAREGAEMILSTVDGFYRKSLTLPH